MTTEQAIAHFMPQITEIALFAKRNNYDVNTQLDEIVREWYKDGSKIANVGNMEHDHCFEMVKMLLKFGMA